MTSRRPGPTTDTEARLAALQARVDQALQLVTDAFRAHPGNRQVTDLCCDVRNALAAQPVGRR